MFTLFIEVYKKALYIIQYKNVLTIKQKHIHVIYE